MESTLCYFCLIYFSQLNSRVLLPMMLVANVRAASTKKRPGSAIIFIPGIFENSLLMHAFIGPFICNKNISVNNLQFIQFLFY